MFTSVKVTYEDGTSSEYEIKMKHAVKFEQRFGNFGRMFDMESEDARPLLATAQLAWIASGDTRPFDDWNDATDKYVLVSDETEFPADAGAPEDAPEPVPTP